MTTLFREAYLEGVFIENLTQANRKTLVDLPIKQTQIIIFG